MPCRGSRRGTNRSDTGRSRSPRTGSLPRHAPRCRNSGTPWHRARAVSASPCGTSDVKPVHLNLIDQRRPRNPELLRPPGAVAAVELEGLFDVHPLDVGARLRLVALVPAPALAEVGGGVLHPPPAPPPAP